MKVSLFITCLVDQLCPNVGVSMVEVLRRVGCEVVFDERQTCCGQPAFNTGYRREAQRFARRFIEIFEESDPEAIVSPSGSCTAMVRHFRELFPEDEEWRRRAERLATRTHEFSGFLVNVLKIDDVGSNFAGRVTWHDACHGLRELGLRDEPRRLLKNVKGIEFVEIQNADVCCGFGGTFSVKFPEISTGILDNKIEAIEKANVTTVVSGDSSCLMQIAGRLSRIGSKIRTAHIAEILASQET
ncbi:MAG: (Fe-S)-binding protein [Pyrinomonadaceae bacterium]